MTIFSRLAALSVGCLLLIVVGISGVDEVSGKPPTEKPKGKTEKTRPKDQEESAEKIAFFEKKIRPVLVEKCYSCHSAAADKHKGGLVLDTREGLRAGGDSGPALIPGDAEKSLILKAIRGDKGVEVMPPKEKLSKEIVKDFTTWIDQGAADPRKGDHAKPTTEIDFAKAGKHWAYQPVGNPTPPTVSDEEWSHSTLDKLVRAALDEKKLTPVAMADKRTLIRRVHYDLVGLPPTPEEVEQFLKDDSPEAYATVVDRLLASSAFGERWGRHWLDVARYAESSGKEQNTLFPFAWRYRDYVIHAFNKDKPYDQFLREQLAGDLLPAKNDDEKAEQLIATGWYAVGSKSLNTPNTKQFKLDVADEQIEAYGQGMLGLTIACARCHDHKFDPIPTKDYYAIAGVFLNTETRFGTPALVGVRQTARLIELPEKANLPKGEYHTKAELDKLRERHAKLKKEREEALEEAKKEKMPAVRLLFIGAQMKVIEKQLDYYDESGKPKKICMGVSDRLPATDSPVYLRGERDKPSATVPRGALQVLAANPMPKIDTGSGRKELAEWTTSRDNPLTSRVMANRIWLHLFGTGIVPTPDNFGVTGRPPSHPELLDHLARKFIDSGWSTKSLIRYIVLSRTYRASSQHHAANAKIDPESTFHWRMNKRRLDAEALRDTVLLVSGKLDLKPRDGSPVSKFEGPVQVLERFGNVKHIYETNHRSVYLPIVRDHVPESLELFDFAEPSLVTGARDDTSTPAQALYLLNDPEILEVSERFADRLLASHKSTEERVKAAFQNLYARPPTTKEREASVKFIDKFVALHAQKKSGKRAEIAALSAFVQSLFASAEFRYLD